MTEGEASAWLSNADVPRGTLRLLATFVDLVCSENRRQNLVATSTVGEIWSRHVVDSLQLVPLLKEGQLIDIGSGAGFPGIVLAAISSGPTTLLEPRAKRAAFLVHCVKVLDLSAHVEIHQQRVEAFTGLPAATITARAVAPLGALFIGAAHLADANTRWVLPKGRTAQSELAATRETWHGDFRVVGSVTDPQAAIIVAEGVRRKAGREDWR